MKSRKYLSVQVARTKNAILYNSKLLSAGAKNCCVVVEWGGTTAAVWRRRVTDGMCAVGRTVLRSQLPARRFNSVFVCAFRRRHTCERVCLTSRRFNDDGDDEGWRFVAVVVRVFDRTCAHDVILLWCCSIKLLQQKS